MIHYLLATDPREGITLAVALEGAVRDRAWDLHQAGHCASCIGSHMGLSVPLVVAALSSSPAERYDEPAEDDRLADIALLLPQMASWLGWAGAQGTALHQCRAALRWLAGHERRLRESAAECGLLSTGPMDEWAMLAGIARRQAAHLSDVLRSARCVQL